MAVPPVPPVRLHDLTIATPKSTPGNHDQFRWRHLERPGPGGIVSPRERPGVRLFVGRARLKAKGLLKALGVKDFKAEEVLLQLVSQCLAGSSPVIIHF